MIAALSPTAETDDESKSRYGLNRVLTVGALVLVIAMVLPFVVYAVPQTVGADHGFIILSGSMEPALSPGDAVVVDGSASVGVGDIITFDDGNAVPTTHRVIGVEGGQYVTQGDANENADSGLVSPDAVLGRVTLTIPLIGYVVLWVNTPIGYIALVLLPISLFLGNELLRWARADADGQHPGDTGPGDVSGDHADGSSSVGLASASTDRQESPGRTGPEPSVDRVNSVEGSVTQPASSTRGGVSAVDLKLSGLSLAILVGYAAWTIFGEIAATGAPSSLSVAVFTGGLLGFASVVWITERGWLSRRRQRRSMPPSASPSANGPGTVQGDDGTDGVGGGDSNASPTDPAGSVPKRDDVPSVEDL